MNSHLVLAEYQFKCTDPESNIPLTQNSDVPIPEFMKGSSILGVYIVKNKCFFLLSTAIVYTYFFDSSWYATIIPHLMSTFITCRFLIMNVPRKTNILQGFISSLQLGCLRNQIFYNKMENCVEVES